MRSSTTRSSRASARGGFRSRTCLCLRFKTASRSESNPGAHMRAAIINSIGDVPVVGEFPAPTAGPGQVVVDVTLAGLNPVDRLRAEGYAYLSPVPPLVAGREGVGVLDGKRVYFHEAVEPYGSFAKQALVTADQILIVPDDLTDE